MDVCAEGVDADIDAVSDDKDDGEGDHADDTVAHHTADLIENGSDNACGKSERQQTAVGQDIAEINCRAL